LLVDDQKAAHPTRLDWLGHVVKKHSLAGFVGGLCRGRMAFGVRFNKLETYTSFFSLLFFCFDNVHNTSLRTIPHEFYTSRFSEPKRESEQGVRGNPA
jgi:hypothetical protein